MSPKRPSARDYLPEIRAKAEAIYAADEVRLPAPEINQFFGLEERSLSPKELEQVRKFVGYAGRRLVAGAVFGESSAYADEQEVEKALNDHSEGVGTFFSLHDSMHAAVTYERTKGATLVPRFLRKTAPEIYLDAETNTEELKALLWGGFVGKHPTLIALMDEKRKRSFLKSLQGRLEAGKILPVQYEAMKRAAEGSDPSDFESVRRGYERIVCSGVKMAIRSNKTLTEDSLRVIDARIDEIFAEHERSPDPDFYATAKRIYEGYGTNPRILFEEFKRTCTPLLEGLVREKRAQEHAE